MKLIILIGIIIFLILLINYPYCPGWNEYWLNKSSDGKCEEICEESGLKYIGRDPDDCFCRDEKCSEYLERNCDFPKQRYHTFKDQLVYMFC